MNQSSLYFSIAPRSSGSQSLTQGGNTFNVYGGDSNCPLRSVNSDITLQILWNYANLTQSDEGTGSSGERVEGDLVNVLFDVFEAVNYTGGTPSLNDDFNLICTIKKAKDAPMEWNGRPADKSPLYGHRFTINIAEVLADLLSYSLVPVGIGTWGMTNLAGAGGPQADGGTQNTYVSQFGGMNGQWVHSNIASNTPDQNRYNLSASGCDRRIRVQARFEIQAADGSLEPSTSPASRGFSDFFIVNAAPQWGDRHQLINRVVTGTSTPTDDGPRFLTNHPSFSNTDPENDAIFKSVRAEDNAEYLQWFQSKLKTQYGAGGIDGFGIKVESCADISFSSGLTTVYLVDFPAGDRAVPDSGSYYEEKQFRQFVQNVSPTYINQHNNGLEIRKGQYSYTATPITTSKPYYRCSVWSQWSAGSVETRLSGYQYYKLDTETKGAWSEVCGMTEGVKFMWLNRMGGIDSYVAKRTFTKGIEVSTETITKKSPDRLHSQDSSSSPVYNNNIGANMYPHSREVLNVDANRKFSALTDPLTTDKANWLEELLTSPNVWVIQKNDGSKYLEEEAATSYTRPSTEGYMPILITDSDVVLIDEEQGLVQLNIEFIESHKINTQRN